jgi:hypothetical protein
MPETSKPGGREMDSGLHRLTNLDGMLLPPLSTQSDYVAYAKEAGFQIFAEPFDISQDVAKTWCASTFIPGSFLSTGTLTTFQGHLALSGRRSIAVGLGP